MHTYTALLYIYIINKTGRRVEINYNKYKCFTHQEVANAVMMSCPPSWN